MVPFLHQRRTCHPHPTARARARSYTLNIQFYINAGEGGERGSPFEQKRGSGLSSMILRARQLLLHSLNRQSPPSRPPPAPSSGSVKAGPLRSGLGGHQARDSQTQRETGARATAAATAVQGVLKTRQKGVYLSPIVCMFYRKSPSGQAGSFFTSGDSTLVYKCSFFFCTTNH